MAVSSRLIIEEIAKRVKSYRIAYPLTQKELAEKSGVSLRSIQMFEQGHDIQFSNLIKILDAMELSDHFSMLVPDVTQRPSWHLQAEKPRQRVRKAKVAETPTVYKWGDEQ